MKINNIDIKFDAAASVRFTRAGGTLEGLTARFDDLQQLSNLCFAVWAASPKSVRDLMDSSEWANILVIMDAKDLTSLIDELVSGWVKAKQ
jgi:hypothetical protein